MIQLMMIRETIKVFVSKYENYVRPAAKFLFALITLSLINGKIGFASRLSNGAIAIIVSLLASFLPLNFIPVIAIGFVMLHLYALSLEATMVIGVIIFMMFLMYFRFTPKDTILLVLTPVLFAFKIPYVIPLVAGLVATPLAIISVGCGTVTYYMLAFISNNVDNIKALGDEEILTKLKFFLDELIYNKEMLVVVIAFGITIATVSVIRRLPVDYAWEIAVVAGALTDIVVIFVGDLKFGTYVSILGVIFGSILGMGVTLVIKFFVFSLDYTKTEKVQFEDDEYYYFVKAVPKDIVNLRRSSHHSSKPVRRHVEDIPSDDEVLHKKSTKSTKRREPITEEDVSRVNRENISSENEYSSYRRKKDGLTDIERAAAAKARASRNK